MDIRIGEVTRHYLKCPFCGGYADLDTHRCITCGATATEILWTHDSPELAMIAHSNHLYPKRKND